MTGNQECIAFDLSYGKCTMTQGLRNAPGGGNLPKALVCVETGCEHLAKKISHLG